MCTKSIRFYRLETDQPREAPMRRSNVNIPPIAAGFQVAGLVVIGAGVAWILISSLARNEPHAASAEPPAKAGRAIIQR